MKNGIVKKIVLGIMAIAFVFVFIVDSIIDLTNKKNVRNAEITQAYELLVIENSINGLIPMGKDYYYLGYSEETEMLYKIHADKRWLSENFDSEGYAKNDSVSVKGLEKKVDYEIEKELELRTAQVKGVKSALGYGRVMELNYVRDSIVKLVAGVLLAIMIVIGLFFDKSKANIPPVLAKVFIVFVVITLVVALMAVM